MRMGDCVSEHNRHIDPYATYQLDCTKSYFCKFCLRYYSY